MNEQVLNVIMKEYEMLRAESQEKQKTQFTMISLIVSAISIVFGLTANLESSAAKISLPILYRFLLPCTIMFFGILWLDQMYRQVMIGVYTAQIENKINSLLKADIPDGMSSIIGWEQWLSARRPTEKFWGKTNYYYAYIGLGTLSVLPIVVFLLGCFLTETPLWPIYLIVLLFVFAVYLLFVALYVKAIRRFDKEIEENRPLGKKGNEGEKSSKNVQSRQTASLEKKKAKKGRTKGKARNRSPK